MPKQCFVPKCKSGYASERRYCRENNVKPASIFKVPTNPELLEKWQRSIPRHDRILTLSDWVCEKHFSSKFIERYFRTKLPNNEEHLIERERPILLPDAVPTKFPNFLEYLSKASPKKRKPFMKHNLANTARKTRRRKLICTHAENSMGGIQPLDEVDNNISIQGSQIDENPTSASSSIVTFDILQKLDFERNSWSKVFIKERNVVRFLYWPSGQTVLMKYVDVREDLSVKVIFGSVATAFVDYKKIEDFFHLHKVLDIMEKTNLCPGAVFNKSQNCRGYSSGNDPLCGKCKLGIRKAKSKKKARRVIT